MPELAEYLARIGHDGPVAADLATLQALHRAHVRAIPFEALDVQLGLVPSMEIQAILDKLVRRRRGGWCYEMNGLFGWALQQIGFPVTRLSCGVMQHVGGEERAHTHLALLVEVDGAQWLADVGFGSSLSEPLPLAVARHAHLPFAVELSQPGEGIWRYTEYERPEGFSYDFLAGPADETLLAGKCLWQSTSPDSNFVQTFVAQRRVGESRVALRGKVLSEVGPGGSSSRELADADEFVTVLRETFGIDEPRAASLWPKIEQRHVEFLAGEAA
ncbi:arylamine N-acetyltransferase [Altererythrobacter salegens]|uniref:Arylamine N-acetyltransferase n=1 Tax=Croceibacterium salegens TaxID=1737568 RepID=A0A6I4STI7_9SPHN|nr:arylamine N-acetyltransferase [Croceibacterium salegens]MXO58357.1 arylamine N-acetyltransferase [Croceibacterium salegens]